SCTQSDNLSHFGNSVPQGGALLNGHVERCSKHHQSRRTATRHHHHRGFGLHRHQSPNRKPTRSRRSSSLHLSRIHLRCRRGSPRHGSGGPRRIPGAPPWLGFGDHGGGVLGIASHAPRSNSDDRAGNYAPPGRQHANSANELRSARCRRNTVRWSSQFTSPDTLRDLGGTGRSHLAIGSRGCIESKTRHVGATQSIRLHHHTYGSRRLRSIPPCGHGESHGPASRNESR
ncbi:MAG: hypothetical protein RL726_725, partial [Actinomycetota bacterium]